jgi:hypothetical protein
MRPSRRAQRYADRIVDEPEIVKLRRDERLRDSKFQATSMSLPLAIHRRLDLLAELMRDLNPSRADIIGMLIAEAELDEERLEERLFAYKKLKVDDVVPHTDDRGGENVVAFPKRRPGRPKRRSDQAS